MAKIVVNELPVSNIDPTSFYYVERKGCGTLSENVFDKYKFENGSWVLKGNETIQLSDLAMESAIGDINTILDSINGEQV